MKQLLLFLLFFPFFATAQELTEANSIHQFKATDIDGNEFEFSCLEGQKILIVNTASKCMYAPQLKKLQELYEKYKNTGFCVIAFPSSDFYNREVKTNKQIAKKYREKYGITFPIMQKTHVKNEDLNPVFDFLSNKDFNGNLNATPKWNFHKYLINEKGHLIKSIPPSKSPFDPEIIDWLEKG
jgi:glutathione peroxidase